MVLLAVPFGLVGGLWLVYLNGYNLSVAVAVGFIALAGMAAEIGVLVLSFIDTEIRALRQQNPGAIPPTALRDGVVNATSKRVRAVVMTVVSTMAGGISAGAEAHPVRIARIDAASRENCVFLVIAKTVSCIVG